MAFWSGQELARRAASENLISNFDAKNIDCASYTMRLGCQVFITQEGNKSRKLLDKGYVPGLRRNLEPDGDINIPPGQFAFLLTEERVRIPSDALGFISIKARYKYKGLVNVSGFHVDPGWDGYLMFSVFNAGPMDIVLQRGEKLFLLWFAALNEVSESVYTYQSKLQSPKPEIQVKYLQGLITAPVLSLPSLNVELNKLKRRVWRGDVALTLALLIIAAIVGKTLFQPHDMQAQRTPDVNVTLARPQSPPQQPADTHEMATPGPASKIMSKVKPASAVSERGEGKKSGTR